MSPELILAIYNIVFPLAWTVIYGLAIAASRVLWKKTENAGPLLLFIGSIGSLLVELSQLVFNLLLTKLLSMNGFTTEFMQQFYLATAFSSVVCNALVFAGIFLIAKEFRAHLEHQKISQDSPKVS
ncbi:MAG: hypothetical protein ACSHYB_15105 [Roseibacillus sp.]